MGADRCWLLSKAHPSGCLFRLGCQFGGHSGDSGLVGRKGARFSTTAFDTPFPLARVAYWEETEGIACPPIGCAVGN